MKCSISIHPPRGGWDKSADLLHTRVRNFNPPTPWGVGQDNVFAQFLVNRFQSTHPVGGGTNGNSLL